MITPEVVHAVADRVNLAAFNLPAFFDHDEPSRNFNMMK